MDHWFRTSRAQVRRHVSGAGQCAGGPRRRCVAKADPVVRWLNGLFRLWGCIRVGEMNYRERRRRSSKTNVRGWSNKEAQSATQTRILSCVEEMKKKGGTSVINTNQTLFLVESVTSHWSAVAYVIDSPNRREDSYVIHAQPTSAEVGDERTFRFHYISNKEVQ